VSIVLFFTAKYLKHQQWMDQIRNILNNELLSEIPEAENYIA
jgi:hypothetical protein